MRKSIADATNNWGSGAENQKREISGSGGKETFDVEINLSLADGKILSGSMDNPLETIERECVDVALASC
jgi:hypothetical protein